MKNKEPKSMQTKRSLAEKPEGGKRIEVVTYLIHSEYNSFYFLSSLNRPLDSNTA